MCERVWRVRFWRVVRTEHVAVSPDHESKFLKIDPASDGAEDDEGSLHERNDKEGVVPARRGTAQRKKRSKILAYDPQLLLVGLATFTILI